MASRQEVAELVALVDRLERLLEHSALSELELEVDGTTIVLRTPAAVAPARTTVVAETSDEGDAGLDAVAILDEDEPTRAAHAVLAPLTGVFYRSPSPGAEPYVREGTQVSAGQVIGLIEAMKLFNEIKSDATGTVMHMGAGDGDLVKAKQMLIEIEPA